MGDERCSYIQILPLQFFQRKESIPLLRKTTLKISPVFPSFWARGSMPKERTLYYTLPKYILRAINPWNRVHTDYHTIGGDNMLRTVNLQRIPAGMILLVTVLLATSLFSSTSIHAANATGAEKTQQPSLSQLVTFLETQKIHLQNGVHLAFSEVDTLPRDLRRAVNNIGNNPARVLVWIALNLGVGLIAEKIFRRFWRKHRPALQHPGAENVGRIYGTLLLFEREILSAFIFFVTTIVCMALTLPQGTPARIVAAQYLFPIFLCRSILAVITTVLAPAHPAIRIVPIPDKGTRILRRWLTCSLIISLFLSSFISLLHRFGISDAQVLFLTLCQPFPVLFILLLLILIHRTATRSFLLGRAADEEDLLFAGWLARHWYVLITGYLLMITTFREVGLLLGHKKIHGPLVFSLMLVPLFFMSAWFVATMVQLLRNEEIHHPHQGIMTRHGTLIIRSVNAVLALSFIGFFLHLWGVPLPFHGVVIKTVLSTLLTCGVGYAVWIFSKASIERHIVGDANQKDSEESEGEGAGGSRRGTLLTLLRKGILIFIAITSALVILKGSGIDIGPLLAGAGIFGLAIGFGSQALVKDIISGIFYLLDDAFRIGDYVDTGNLKGTVEQISIRSFKLRHHRGMLHTIPYGTLGSITNFSRDWCVMNLDLRLPFDTDVDLVRKIVKKIGKKLAAQEEYGPKLLSDIKSKGIRQIDDSALVIRVKFKSKPGVQFVLRKELYQAIQREFSKNNIKFAPRKVTVDIPDTVPEKSRTAIIAAAEDVLAGEEKRKADMKEKDGR